MSGVFREDANSWALEELESDYRKKKRALLERIRDAEYVVFDPKVGDVLECVTNVPAKGWHVDWAGLTDNVQKELVVGKRYVIERLYPTRGIAVFGVLGELHVTYFRKVV